MMTESDSIIVKNVSKSFNLGVKNIYEKLRGSKNSDHSEFFALKDISFNVKKGEILGIIGANGSGKTTLLRTIAGIYKPDSGYVKTNGTIAPILHIGTGFNNELDAIENIMVYGMLLGIPKSEMKKKVKDIIKWAEVDGFSNVKLKKYSSGMRARLAFATALQINPDILLVDEVLAVGDRRFKEKSFQAFSSFKKQGKTILYVTHSLKKITNLSDRVLLMDHGKIIGIGSPEEIIKKYDEMMTDQTK